MTEPAFPTDFSIASISPHAANEIQRRLLPAEAIAQTLAQPEQVVVVRPGRVILHLRYEASGREYLLRVVIDISRLVVVTIYRTSKIDKYWSPE